MGNIIRLHPSEDEYSEIFDEGVATLSRALELFMMIECLSQDAGVMVDEVYKVFKLAENIQDGYVSDNQ